MRKNKARDLEKLLFEFSTSEEKESIAGRKIMELMDRFDELYKSIELSFDKRDEQYSEAFELLIKESDKKIKGSLASLKQEFRQEIGTIDAALNTVDSKTESMEKKLNTQINSAKTNIEKLIENAVKAFNKAEKETLKTINAIVKDGKENLSESEIKLKKVYEEIASLRTEMIQKIGASAGGGSLYPEQYETPTGSVDGSNTVFFVQNPPKSIIVDGLKKFQSTHYTFSNHKITITDGAPPVLYMRSIY